MRRYEKPVPHILQPRTGTGMVKPCLRVRQRRTSRAEAAQPERSHANRYPAAHHKQAAAPQPETACLAETDPKAPGNTTPTEGEAVNANQGSGKLPSYKTFRRSRT